jgi:hypothetical protein
MLLFPLLLLQSTTTADLSSFVAIRPDHRISISAQAEELIADSAVLVLATGSPGSGKSFLRNNLHRGPGHDPFSEYLLATGGGFVGVTRDFPFPLRIPVRDFCRIWGINCSANFSNHMLVFIDSEGADALGYETERIPERLFALCAIVSVRIHVAPPDWLSVGNVAALLQGTGVKVLMTGKDAHYDLAIVVPRIGLNRSVATNNARAYREARREQDGTVTDLLRTELIGGNATAANKTTVFLQPEGRLEGLYWDARTRLAQHVVRAVVAARSFSPEDAFALFHQAGE